jgi:hypothetical protein
VRFDRLDGRDIWHGGGPAAESFDKAFEVIGDGSRWPVNFGERGMSNGEDRFSLFLSDPDHGLSRRDLDFFVQELRGEIRTVRPDDRVQLRIEPELPEKSRVLERDEHLTLQLGGEIDLSLGSIREPHQDHVVPHVMGLRQSWDHTSLQWFDPPKRSALSSQFPILQQLVPMHLVPVQDVAEGSSRKLAAHHPGLDVDRDLMFTVNRVKVRGCMIAKEDRYDDSQKARYLRHIERVPGTLMGFNNPCHGF